MRNKSIQGKVGAKLGEKEETETFFRLVKTAHYCTVCAKVLRVSTFIYICSPDRYNYLA
jgi:hypothetical protein